MNPDAFAHRTRSLREVFDAAAGYAALIVQIQENAVRRAVGLPLAIAATPARPLISPPYPLPVDDAPIVMRLPFGVTGELPPARCT